MASCHIPTHENGMGGPFISELRCAWPIQEAQPEAEKKGKEEGMKPAHRCPDCHSRSVRAYRTTARCNTCWSTGPLASFAGVEVAKPDSAAVKASGKSGIVAGYITHGRGSKWGAGLV